MVDDPYLGGKSIEDIKTSAKNIYKLSSNENPVGSSPQALAAIRKGVDQLHLYPDRTGEKLYQALSHFYNSELSPDHFVACNSGSGTLQLIIDTLIEPGDEVFISNPAFGLYKKLTGWQDGIVKDVPLLLPSFSLDVDGLLNAITAKTKIIFLGSPNNPTGSYLSRSTIRQLLSGIPKHVVVVLDEVYWQFASAADISIAKPFVIEGHNIIGVNSFSKNYGLAGLRLGYCYSNVETIERLRNKIRPFLLNSLAIKAGIAALGDQSFLEESVKLVKEGRAFLYKSFEKLGVQYWKSQGNFVLFKPKVDSFWLEDQLIQYGIMVREVSNFGAPGCLRVSIGKRDAMISFIDALTIILAKKNDL